MPKETTKVVATHTINGIKISVVSGDIAEIKCEALVNAANSQSFTPMDNGVSGALRRACEPDDVCRKPKRFWDDEGKEHTNAKLPTTQAGVQPAAGKLKQRGVKHVIHAVGPIWTDVPIGPKAFRVIPPQIVKTAKRALNAAAKVDAVSVAMPAISGGIFTHYKEGTNVKEKEQLAAREAVSAAVLAWAGAPPAGTSVREVMLVDLGDSRGQLAMLKSAFLAAVEKLEPEEKESMKPDGEGGAASPPAVPRPPSGEKQGSNPRARSEANGVPVDHDNEEVSQPSRPLVEFLSFFDTQLATAAKASGSSVAAMETLVADTIGFRSRQVSEIDFGDPSGDGKSQEAEEDVVATVFTMALAGALLKLGRARIEADETTSEVGVQCLKLAVAILKKVHQSGAAMTEEDVGRVSDALEAADLAPILKEAADATKQQQEEDASSMAGVGLQLEALSLLAMVARDPAEQSKLVAERRILSEAWEKHSKRAAEKAAADAALQAKLAAKRTKANDKAAAESALEAKLAARKKAKSGEEPTPKDDAKPEETPTKSEPVVEDDSDANKAPQTASEIAKAKAKANDKAEADKALEAKLAAKRTKANDKAAAESALEAKLAARKKAKAGESVKEAKPSEEQPTATKEGHPPKEQLNGNAKDAEEAPPAPKVPSPPNSLSVPALDWAHTDTVEAAPAAEVLRQLHANGWVSKATVTSLTSEAAGSAIRYLRPGQKTAAASGAKAVEGVAPDGDEEADQLLKMSAAAVLRKYADAIARGDKVVAKLIVETEALWTPTTRDELWANPADVEGGQLGRHRWVLTGDIPSLLVASLSLNSNRRVCVADDTSDASLAALVSKFPAVSRLDLCGTRALTDAGVSDAIRALDKLKVLDVSDTEGRITDESLKTLASVRGPQIEALAVANTGGKITNLGVVAVVKAAKDALAHLDVSNNNYQDEAISSETLLAVAASCSKLKSLDIRQTFDFSSDALMEIGNKCRLKSFKASSGGNMGAFWSAVEKSTQLRQLVLNNFRWMFGSNALPEAIKRSGGILQHVELTGADATKLGDALDALTEHASDLRSLDLSGVRLNADNCAKLGPLLKKQSKLRRLSLSVSDAKAIQQIDDSEIASLRDVSVEVQSAFDTTVLVKILKRNTNLHSVDIVGQADGEKLVGALAALPLRKLRLELRSAGLSIFGDAASAVGTISTEAFQALAAASPDLEELELLRPSGNSEATDAWIAVLLKHSSQLRRLSLRGSAKIDGSSAFSDIRTPTLLTDVNLGSTKVNDTGVAALVKCSPDLIRLSLDRTQVTNASLNVVAEDCPRLRLLDATGSNGISVKSTDDFSILPDSVCFKYM